MSSPLPLPSPPPNLYTDLLSALQPTGSAGYEILEIDILPSSYPPILQHDHPSLAIPKSLLIPIFLTARKRYIDYVQCVRPPREDYTAALEATLIILLWEPNHLTAANFRKRHLAALRDSLDAIENDHEAKETLHEAVRREVAFSSSLLTSPLPRHVKSSTLWAHRSWVVRSFTSTLLGPPASEKRENEVGEKQRLWSREMEIVMKAGERHARNYYAWQYARWCFEILLRYEGLIEEEDMLVRVHKWCLQQPRDISGWAFLVWLLRMGENGKAWESAIDESADGSAGRRIVWETREFVRKFEWSGESVEWFLKVMD